MTNVRKWKCVYDGHKTMVLHLDYGDKHIRVQVPAPHCWHKEDLESMVGHYIDKMNAQLYSEIFPLTKRLK